MTTDSQSTETQEPTAGAAEGVEGQPTSDTVGVAVEDTETVSSDSRNWATFAHLSAFVMFLGIPSLLGPLVVWLAKRDDPYVEAQAKEALNFNISMFIYAIAAGISVLLLIGLIALPAVFVTWFVLVIVAAIRSADGEQYRYPFTIRLVS
ncbi:MAG TPA: DUF4870 domain-containing protein [Acidimicrobiia bacterium]|jgi:uncharacterized Tic20 family protein